MSFRARLSLFFLLVVVVPVMLTGALVISLTESSADARLDATLDADLRVAVVTYQDTVALSESTADQLAADPAFRSALAAANGAGASRAAVRMGVVRLEVTSGSDQPVAVLNPEVPVVGQVRRELGDSAGQARTMALAVEPAADYMQEVTRLTGSTGGLTDSTGTLIAGRLENPDNPLPPAGSSADVEDLQQRARTATLPGPENLSLTLFVTREDPGFLASSPRVIILILIFLMVAALFVAIVMRSLRAQVSEMLSAARQLGDGDFSAEVPVVGNDEMAALASEFNKMSGRVSDQMQQLSSQQQEIDRSVHRIGEAFAAGLDREAMLVVLVDTAIGACEASYGRICLNDGTIVENGDDAVNTDAVDEAQNEARDRSALVARHEAGVSAIAAPMIPPHADDQSVGVITIARRGAEFAEHEQSDFRYLAEQASASVENIDAHEQISELARTDDLTGLANNRAFNEWIDREAERSARYGHELSLLMLDIDDFKLVNDTHGHLQGDQVLRRIGAVLASDSRNVDLPARYGGEEFAVALTETGIDGAIQVAKRLRALVEAERVPLLGGSRAVHVTTSIGVASTEGTGLDVRGLVAAADSALYQAKREGKNRVAVAGRGGDPGQATPEMPGAPGLY